MLGEGIVREEEVITLNIPAGVSEGMQTLYWRAKGECLLVMAVLNGDFVDFNRRGNRNPDLLARRVNDFELI